jgi:hypothetical protein
MSDDDHCRTCGMTWTPAHLLWQPLTPCNCGGHHTTPAENEQLQHGHGRHNYRAFLKNQRPPEAT